MAVLVLQRRGQVWYIDVFIAVSVLILVSLLYFNHISSTTSFADPLEQDALAIAGLLMSPGFPADWTASTVIVPGVVDNYRLNEQKVGQLFSMNLAQLQGMFQTTHNIYIYFRQDGVLLPINGTEYAGRPPTSIARDIAHVQRVALYEEFPVTMHVVVWGN